MQPRLQAEEALVAAAAGLAGNPMTEADDRKRIITPWERMLEAQVERPKPTKLAPDEFAMRMKLLGIEVADGSHH
jgi:hypothetical protein